MKEQIIKRSTQRKLSAVAFVLEAIMILGLLIVGSIDSELTDFHYLVIVLVGTLVVTLLLGCIAYFLNDVRRFYRLVLPTYAIISAFMYNKFHSKSRSAKYFGRWMEKHNLTYLELAYDIQDRMDDIYGYPEEI